MKVPFLDLKLQHAPLRAEVLALSLVAEQHSAHC